MVLLSFMEIFDLIMMTAVISLIFMSMFMPIVSKPTLIPRRKWFDWKAFKYAALITAPGIVFHELSHKFAAMAYGFSAVFHAWPLGLGIGLVLKLINSPFVLIAPGYVNICNGCPLYSLPIPPLQSAVIAFAGPAINLILWLGTMIILKRAKKLKRKHMISLMLISKINMILFIFNMIPLGPLDGAKVLEGIIAYFSG